MSTTARWSAVPLSNGVFPAPSHVSSSQGGSSCGATVAVSVGVDVYIQALIELDKLDDKSDQSICQMIRELIAVSYNKTADKVTATDVDISILATKCRKYMPVSPFEVDAVDVLIREADRFVAWLDKYDIDVPSRWRDRAVGNGTVIADETVAAVADSSPVEVVEDADPHLTQLAGIADDADIDDSVVAKIVDAKAGQVVKWLKDGDVTDIDPVSVYAAEQTRAKPRSTVLKAAEQLWADQLG